MGSKDWTCEPRQHDFTEFMARGSEASGLWEPQRLYCRKCGWVRDVPIVEWCVSASCSFQAVRHEEHHVDLESQLAQRNIAPQGVANAT